MDANVANRMEERSSGNLEVCWSYGNFIIIRGARTHERTLQEIGFLSLIKSAALEKELSDTCVSCKTFNI